MLKVGVTGGLGSGKSIVASRFAKLGADVIDADKLARNLIETNKSIKQDLVETFSEEILNHDGEIHRQKLARVAFANEDSQMKLNAIVHPYIIAKIDDEFERIAKISKYKLMILDAALIFEGDLHLKMDYSILVTAPLKIRLQRALDRGGISKDDILRRMDLQMPEDIKMEFADFVIQNTGSQENLLLAVDKLYEQLI